MRKTKLLVFSIMAFILSAYGFAGKLPGGGGLSGSIPRLGPYGAGVTLLIVGCILFYWYLTSDK